MELKFRGRIKQQMTVVCYTEGLSTLTVRSEAVRSETLETFEKHIEKLLVLPCM